MCAEGEVELHLTNEGVVEYEDWGGGGSIRRRRTVGCRGELRVRRASCADPDGFTFVEQLNPLGSESPTPVS